jgi:hypothetical protein
MNEASIHKAVVAHWRALGLPGTLVATIPNMGAMGQYGLTKGLPDLMVLAPGLPVGFIELKAAKGRVSEAQIVFKDRCEALNVPHAITYGRDEPIKLLEQWKVVRSPL